MHTFHTANNGLPQHLAIIMDGNGRWATQRNRERTAGHHKGFETALRLIKFCVQEKIKIVSLFAFSTENWKRPAQELNSLSNLLEAAFQEQLDLLVNLNVQLQVVGDLARFSLSLQQKIKHAQAETQANTGLKLVIAASYGGQWDIVQAARQITHNVLEGKLTLEDISIQSFQNYLQLGALPSPDLCIRTGGEYRISNFFMWHLAYTEFYFTETLWPDFDELALKKAFDFYKRRNRRFGALA